MLNGALSIGRTGLTASQLGLNVSGNNVANAATPGFTRQRMDLAPLSEQPWGRFRIGRGVDVQGIRRMADEGLQQRLLAATSSQGAADTNSGALADLANLIGTFDRNGNTALTAEFNRFFDAWSNLTTGTGGADTRGTVITRGSALAQSLRSLRSDIASRASNVEADLSAAVTNANGLLSQFATLNAQIVNAGASAAGLIDQRDQVLAQLANLMDITPSTDANGSMSLYVGSTLLASDGTSRGIKLDINTDASGNRTVAISTQDNSESITPAAGRIGALLSQTTGTGAPAALARLDRVTGELIYQVNRAYSQGAPLTPVQRLSGVTEVAAPDRALAINDPANNTFASLTNRPTSGAITLRVRNDTTGQFSEVSIPIDLDGLTTTGAPGFTDDTSVNSLLASLNAVPNLSATLDSAGRLQINAGPGSSVSVTSDTSGILTTLGVNTYFIGTDAATINVRADVTANPALLNVRTIANGSAVDNGVSKIIAELRTKGLASLGGASILGDWSSVIQETGVQADAAATAGATAKAVADNLQAQRDAVSGVSLDEEAINLVLYQTQYQASARYITVVQDLTQTLLGLIR
ncbi:MAG: flagellar hook-associated protein FlgK [Phycisphaerales bacterium]|nr:flagellar hook-associated protein FlgK [Phycisphaerales bacterium]